ncbi:ankyrin repeat domain-containing protein [Deinococcus planocerae]|uniref:ankyrin repeat domain-containing protein n=1 Tax=Deinococcus planocerae TaxID=1737569 RepID=UPI0011AF492F|nr:ankyrin repeat domain-containing protein [Deinococcus planocerae]
MTPPSSEQALFAALQTNDEGSVRALLDRDPTLLRAVSPLGVSPVLFATYYGKHDLARLLIERMREAGVPLTVFEAAATGELSALREHLDAQPDLADASSPDGFTPLGLAAFFGREEVAAELLARGADVNRASTNAMGARPLHSAVAGDHTALALRLIAAGADVNAPQHGGFTPLLGAAQNGSAVLVEALLAVGADPGARTEGGQGAADLAQEEGHAGVLAILSGAGHDPEESRNVTLTATRDTGPMTNNGDGRRIDAPPGPPTGEPVNELTGRPDDHTGYQAPDPKDTSQPFYTSTPAEDRVSSSNESKYEPVEMPDPKEVTGQFDHLATRDPSAMEHRLQAPEFAGAQTVGTGLDSAVLDATVPAGLGVNASLLTVSERRGEAVDPNPGYTPPAQEVPPHLGSTPADLPPGVRPEVQEAVQGDGDPKNS